MAYVYASLLGTTVLRHKVVPQRPQRFDGRVRVYGVPEAVTEASCSCSWITSRPAARGKSRAAEQLT